MTAKFDNPDEDISTIFSALGDETRLAIISVLRSRPDQSITVLCKNFALTRQAVTRHLGVLEHAGLIRRRATGREIRFTLEQEKLGRARDYLERASQQWEEAAERLAAHLGD